MLVPGPSGDEEEPQVGLACVLEEREPQPAGLEEPLLPLVEEEGAVLALAHEVEGPLLVPGAGLGLVEEEEVEPPPHASRQYCSRLPSYRTRMPGTFDRVHTVQREAGVQAGCKTRGLRRGRSRWWCSRQAVSQTSWPPQRA